MRMKVTGGYGYIWTVYPYVEAQTITNLFPKCLIYKPVAGIDFDKGCYIGSQNRGARQNPLGRNKRASYILIHQGVDISETVTQGMALEKQAR